MVPCRFGVSKFWITHLADEWSGSKSALGCLIAWQQKCCRKHRTQLVDMCCSHQKGDNHARRISLFDTKALPLAKLLPYIDRLNINEGEVTYPDLVKTIARYKF